MGTATVPLCQHWMDNDNHDDNATRCGCPAMRGTRYCYFHRLEQTRAARKKAERARQRWFESATLADPASVHRALVQVITRLLSGNIGHQQAGPILYKLQTASVNLRRAGLGPGKADDKPSGLSEDAHQGNVQQKMLPLADIAGHAKRGKLGVRV
ncbi:MAG TPA: hypothetical protein VI386_08900 [Candidatus Sulfotelmatobacter sp.]